MKFSIVTPVRNGMPFLRSCVGSVRAQTHPDREHVIRDACSTDGTVKWLCEQADLIQCSQSDDGMYDAINQGWQTCSGDVLSWLNSDEQYLPDTLSLVHRAFEMWPDADVVFGNYLICETGSGQPVSARKEIPLRYSYVLNGTLYALSCTLFFRRSLLDNGQLMLNTTFKDVGDADLVLRLLAQGVRVVHVPRYLAIFGVTGRNMSTGQNALLETDRLRHAYGAHRTLPGRLAVRALRWAEKLVRGCYFPSSFNYRFCVDETGRSRQLTMPAFRWRWRA